MRAGVAQKHLGSCSAQLAPEALRLGVLPRNSAFPHFLLFEHFPRLQRRQSCKGGFRERLRSVAGLPPRPPTAGLLGVEGRALRPARQEVGVPRTHREDQHPIRRRVKPRPAGVAGGKANYYRQWVRGSGRRAGCTRKMG